MKRLLAFAALLVAFVSAAPVGAAPPASNVALGATVTLHGDAFFTAGWGGGLTVPASSVTDGVFLPRGTQWDQGAVWWDQYGDRRGEIVVDLGRRCRIEALVVQVDDNDAYSLRYASPSGLRVAWMVPNYDAAGAGMQTRPDPANDAALHVLARPIVTDRLVLRAMPAASNDRYFSVSEIQAYGACRHHG